MYGHAAERCPTQRPGATNFFNFDVLKVVFYPGI